MRWVWLENGVLKYGVGGPKSGVAVGGPKSGVAVGGPKSGVAVGGQH
jgi:hypothetical protein